MPGGSFFVLSKGGRKFGRGPAGHIRFSPGGCCQCTCLLLSDTFDRADDTDLGTNWSEVSGNWEIASNQLKITATPNAFVKSTVEHPLGLGAVSLTLASVTGTAGDIVRLIAGYTDADNYVFADFTIGTGDIRIFKRVAGVETELADPRPSESSTNLQICLGDDGHFWARTSAADSFISATNVPVGGGGFGIGTGATHANAMTVNNFTASRNDSGCPRCDCSFCDEEQAPNEWRVVIAGISNNSCTGSDCPKVDGTYIVQGGVNPTEGTFDQCDWLHEIVASHCSGTSAFVHLTLGGVGGNTIFVSVTETGGLLYSSWSKTYGSDPDCDVIGNEALTYIAAGYSGSRKCKGDASATCHITAL